LDTRSHGRRCWTPLLLLTLAVGCSGERGSGPGGRPVATPRSVARSPLFVHFPELDDRIVEVDPGSGKALRTVYPDSWAPGVGRLLDFAVSPRGKLFGLVAGRQGADVPRLFVVNTRSGALERTVDLPPLPQSLSWDCAGRLWVGHATPPEGPPGQVSLVDAGKLAVVRRVPLEGAAASVAPLGRGALVIERRVETLGDQVYVRSSLVALDGQGRVRRRRELPPGAREAILGPAGRLNVAHASGPGTLATDGTVSVVDRESLEVVRRLRLEMVVRRMIPAGDRMVLNMLSSTGDVWIAVMDGRGKTLFDFRLGELVGPDLVVLGRAILIPLRRDQTLLRFPLDGRGKLPKLRIRGAESAGDRLGMIRTWMTCDGA